MSSPLVAFFVSSHGFGHAARAAAVIEALHTRRPELGFAIFTDAPRWFFKDSLTPTFDYIRCQTDVGLVQKTPMDADLSATNEALDVACALIEKFTWDWIYRAYLDVELRFEPFIRELQ